ncbi:hypothetical protein HMPREF1211_00037 [Streptomyces sp. HGB0020]|nr:hypothetical protein HMPREF1211_00037 [Streptomyces sp. HGB0020]
MNLHCVRRGSAGPGARRSMQSVLGAAAVLALVAGCGTGRTSNSAASVGDWKAPKAVSDALKKEGEVQVILHDNSSSSVQAQLYAAVLRAFGGNVKIATVNDYPSTFAILSKAKNQVDPEMWTGSAPDLVKKYIKDDKTVDMFEVSDVDKTAAEGWYVPTYVIKGDPARGIKPSCPGLPDWRALNKCVDVFKTPDSGGKGRYLSGAKSWEPAYGDNERIKNLKLNYKVAFAGSEAALQAEWTRAEEQGKPILALMWSPHYLTSKYSLTKIKFPPYTPDCWGPGKSYACDWGPLNIDKLTSRNFRGDYPAAAQVLDNYNLDGKQLGEMMTQMVDSGKTADQVVADWMKKNPSVWQAWSKGADK